MCIPSPPIKMLQNRKVQGIQGLLATIVANFLLLNYFGVSDFRHISPLAIMAVLLVTVLKATELIMLGFCHCGQLP